MSSTRTGQSNIGAKAMIDLDFTAVIQFINFLITLVVLNYLLITPIRKILRQRKETMEMIQDSVNATNEISEGKLENYKKSLDEYRGQAALEREEFRSQALARERELTEVAMADAQAKLQKARHDIATQAGAAMVGLKQAVPTLAKEATNRILA